MEITREQYDDIINYTKKHNIKLSDNELIDILRLAGVYLDDILYDCPIDWLDEVLEEVMEI